MKIKEKKEKKRVCVVGFATQTQTVPLTHHLSWLQKFRKEKKKKKKKERSTKDVASFVFPFQFWNEKKNWKIKWNGVCVCRKCCHTQ